MCNGIVKAAVACLALTSGLASAATFNLFEGDVTSGTYTSQQHGLTLTVTTVQGKVRMHNSKGLGVRVNNDDTNALDNTGPDEFLRFEFSTPVTLSAVTLSQWQRNDEMVFTVGSDSLLYTGNNNTFALDQPLTLTSFDIATSSVVPQTFSAFRVKSLDVAAAVPLPAAAWLFGSALAGILTIRRRRV